MARLSEFGKKDGVPLVKVTLEGTNSSISILSLGAITQNWVHSGDKEVPIVLGYDDPKTYLTDPFYFGAIVGRVANRTAFGRFVFEGVEYHLPVNDPPNHLHGGPEGTQRWNFAAELDSTHNSVTLTHTSPDGHMGYPGAIDFTITITLRGDCLTYEMLAVPDRPTPINLAQHSYYNLVGYASCHDHSLWLDASANTPVDDFGIPTGIIKSTHGTRFDFSQPRILGQMDTKGEGLDINMVLNNDRNLQKPAVVLQTENRKLEIITDQRGMQIYDSLHLKSTPGGHNGVVYKQFSGLALEPQAFPNFLNTPAFGSIIALPDKPYRQITSVKVSNCGTKI